MSVLPAANATAQSFDPSTVNVMGTVVPSTLDIVTYYDTSGGEAMQNMMLPPIASCFGTLVDEDGNAIGGTPVVLHVMNGDTEIYNITTVSSSYMPYVGAFTFDNIILGSDVYIGYVTAGMENNGTTYNGRSDGFPLIEGRTSTGAIVLKQSTGTASVYGSAVDSFNTGYGGLPVTLHVLNGMGTELRNYTTTTSIEQPYVGAFTFDQVDMSDGASGGYVSSAAQLSEYVSVSGRSNDFMLWPDRTSSCSVVLRIPMPDDIIVTADTNPITGMGTSIINAQLMLNGQPYHRMNIPVSFWSDNDAIAYLPQMTMNLTDIDGRTTIILTADTVPGSVDVSAVSWLMMGAYIYNTTTVYCNVPLGSQPVGPGPITLPATASWSGTVVDTYGAGYGGIPVTLHVMDSSGAEVYNMTRTTNVGYPYTGSFCFDYILPGPGYYGYVTAEAQISEYIFINGSSLDYPLYENKTATGSIVLHIPLPDAIEVISSRDTILVGGDCTMVTAQIYLNGMPYHRSGIAVMFSSDNDDVATLPSVRYNITDLNGQTTILLTSNNMPGHVNVNALSYITYGVTLSDTATVNVADWGTISGIVTDQNKDGLPNAVVKLWHCEYNEDAGTWDAAGMVSLPENPQLTNGGMTAAVGTYTFYRVPAGLYMVTAEMDGYSYYALVNVDGGSATANVVIQDYSYMAPMSLSGVTLMSAAPDPSFTGGLGAISGIVTDAENRGITDATVTLWSTTYNPTNGVYEASGVVPLIENPQIANSGSTAAPGMYTFVYVPVGVYLVDADNGSQEYQAIVSVSNGTETANVVLGGVHDYSYGALSGIVTDRNKNAIPGACVTLRDNSGMIIPISGNPLQSNDGSTAASGMYSFINVPVGDYRVTAEIDGYAYYADVTITQGTSTANIAIPDYVYTPPTYGDISGIVTDMNKAGVPGATVILWHCHQEPGGEWLNDAIVPMPDNPVLTGDGSSVTAGYYEFYGVLTGMYNVTAEKDGHISSGLVCVTEDLSVVNIAIPDYIYIPESGYGATYVSNTIPDSMVKGQPYDVSITFSNTGTTAWSESYKVRLAIWGNNASFGINGDCVSDSGYAEYTISPGTTVMPGEEYTWHLSMTPTGDGGYWLGFSPVRDSATPMFIGSETYAFPYVWLGTLNSTVLVNFPEIPILYQPYDANITAINTGTAVWTENSSIRLAVWGNNPAGVGLNGNLTGDSGYREYVIPAGVNVYPGEEYTWHLNATPVTEGGYWLGFGTVMDSATPRFFGPEAYAFPYVWMGMPNATVEVTCPDLPIVYQPYDVSVTATNVGSAVWTEDSHIRLAVWGNDPMGVGLPGDLIGDSGYREYVLPSGVKVYPGQSYTWHITATPTTQGGYWLGFGMVKDSSSPWFFGSQPYAFPYVWLGMPDQTYVSDTIPGSMTAGQTYHASITFLNTGSAVWTEYSKMRLAVWGNNNVLGLNGDCTSEAGYAEYTIPAGTYVMPGQQYTWTFDVTPTAPGSYWLGLSPMQDKASPWFYGTPTYKTQTVDSGLTTLTPGILSVATDASWAPFESINTTTGQPEGFDIDLMNEIGHDLGLNVAYTNQAFHTIIPGITANEYDCAISAFTITPERRIVVDFTEPYYTEGSGDEYGIVVNKGNPGLTAAMNSSLAAMKADGRYTAIYDKWFV